MLVNQLNNLNINHDIVNHHEHSNLDCFAANQLGENIDFEKIVNSLNFLFSEHYSQPLSMVESLILEGVWQKKTYSEIARENNYSSDYFSNVAAPKLLKKLSILCKCRVTKRTCRSVVQKYIMKNDFSNFYNHKNENKNVSYTSQTRKYSSAAEDKRFNSSYMQNTILLAQAISELPLFENKTDVKNVLSNCRKNRIINATNNFSKESSTAREYNDILSNRNTCCSSISLLKPINKQGIHAVFPYL